MPRAHPKFAVGDLVVLSPADTRVKEVVEVEWDQRGETWTYWCLEIDDPKSTHFNCPERVLMRYESPEAGGRIR